MAPPSATGDLAAAPPGGGRVAPLLSGDPATLGPYRLLGRLGQGGMGVVYLGEGQGGSRVAVKAIRADLDGQPDLRERFGHEVDAARRVARFCTAPVLDAGLDDDPPWVASEFVDGPTLQEVVVGRGPLPASSLEGLAVGVAGALAAIHAAGVVHRDLKPSNVLLSPVGPRVIDFGIARLDDGSATSTSAGTPAFMAPEQHEGEPVGPPADVFAWGAMVAFAGTGRLTFGGGQAASIAYRVVYGQPDLAGLSGPLAELVARALAKDPDERPSAWELLSRLTGGAPDVGRAAADVLRRRWSPELLLAKVRSGTGPGSRPGRRRRRGRVATAAVLAGLLVLGGVATATIVAGSGPDGDIDALQPPPTGKVPPWTGNGPGGPPPTLLEPEITIGRAPRRGRPVDPPSGLPEARLLLFDDFSARGNGWPEERPEETGNGSSIGYADGAYRLIGDDSSTLAEAAVKEMPDLVRLWVDVDVAWAGHPRGRMTVDCPGSADVVLTRDGSYRIEDSSAGPDDRPLKTGKVGGIDPDGWTRLGIGCVTSGKRTTVTIVVDGDEELSFTGPNPEPIPTHVEFEIESPDETEPSALLLDNLAVWGEDA